MRQQEIFVSGFPCSETFWLSRILSDLLDAPLRQYPHSEGVYHGDGTDGAYTIRQRFWLESEYTRTGYYGGSGMVYIQRDPRDVAAKMFLTKEVDTINGAVDFMVENSLYLNWMQSWIDSNKTNICVRYEDICVQPAKKLNEIVRAIAPLHFSKERLEQAFLKQSSDIRIAFWEDCFTRKLGKELGDNLNLFMTEQRYIQSVRWWAVLPK